MEEKQAFRIEISADALISLKDAAAFVRELTKDSHAPNRSAVWRWCVKGLKGVYMPHVRIGGKIYTTQAAVIHFINETTTASALRFCGGHSTD